MLDIFHNNAFKRNLLVVFKRKRMKNQFYGLKGKEMPLGRPSAPAPSIQYGEGGGFRMGNTCIPVADSF